MSNEIYCEVIGQMTLTIPVKIRLTVRSAPGSTPAKAVYHFCRTGETEHADGNIEDEEYEIAPCGIPAIDEILPSVATSDEDATAGLTRAIAWLHGVLPIMGSKIEVIDAK
jgi:hypothetical protein